MINDFLGKIKGQSVLLSNVMSLGIVQVANCLIPILIVPFVTNALNVEMYGKTVFAQNIISYLTILVNFGFEYSATQDIAINKGDKEKLRAVFWSVIRHKLCLLLISFILLWVCGFFYEKVSEDKYLFFYAALINVGFVFFPSWFFQGIEKMFSMSIFNLAIKGLGAILIVLVINEPSDYRIYILILSLSYVLVGLLAFAYVIRKYDLKYEPFDRNIDVAILKKGLPIFVNNLFAALYATSGITLIGAFMTDYDTGVYSGAHRIISAILMVTSMPISVALFPLVSRKFNESRELGWLFFKKSIVIVGFLSLTLSIFVYFASDIAVDLLLRGDFEGAKPLLRIFSALPFLVMIASFLTVQGLYGMQLQKYAPYIGISVALICVCITYFTLPKYGIYGAAYSYIVAEILEIGIAGAVLFFCKKKDC